MSRPAPRCLPKFTLANLLLTSALVGLGVGGFGTQVRADAVLNIPWFWGSVDWRSDSDIWMDEWRVQRSLRDGELGVIDLGRYITIDVEGTVRPGALWLNSSGVNVRAGVIGDVGGDLRLGARSGLVMAVGSELRGNVTTAGEGTVIYYGSSTGLETLNVEAGSTLQTFSGATTSGTLNNDGSVEFEGNHDGNVVNNGDIDLRGNITGTLANRAADGVVNASGDAEIGTIINDGEFNISGGVTVTSSNEAQNRGIMRIDGVLDADLNNSGGTALNGGAINGAVTNSGQLNAAGEITGVVTNITGGAVETQGNLVVGGLANEGFVTVRTGEELTSRTTVVNNNSLTVAGTLDGDLDNLSKDSVVAVTTLQNGRIEGNVTNTSKVTGSGTVVGSFTNRTGGVLESGGELDVGQIVNDGTVDVKVDTRLSSDATMINNGKVDVAGNLVSAVDNTGQLSINGGIIDGDFFNSGTASGRGQIRGAVVNRGGGRLTAEGNLLVREITNAGTVTIGQDAVLRAQTTIINNGNVVMDGGRIGGEFLNAGGGTATLRGDAEVIDNAGTIDVDGRLEVDEITSNSGTINIGAEDVLAAIEDEGASGKVNSSGTINLSGTLRADGGLTNAGALNIDEGLIRGNLTNEGAGTLSVAGNSTVDGSLTNRGVIDSANTEAASLTIKNGTFINHGALQATGGILTVQAQDIGLRDGSTVDGSRVRLIGDINNGSGSDLIYENDAKLWGSLKNEAGGSVTINAELDARQNNITNAGVISVSEGGGNLINVDAFKNNGVVRVDDGASLEAKTVTNRPDGTLEIAGGVTAVNGLTNRGTVNLTGSVTGGAFNNAQGATANLGGLVDTLVNRGTVRTNGDLSVGKLSNLGSFSVLGTDTLVLDETLKNGPTGEITLTGAVEGRINNTGSYTQTGILDGSLVTSGSATINGRIERNLHFTGGELNLRPKHEIGGTFQISEDFVVGETMRVNARDTRVAPDTVLTLEGTINGNLRNEARVDVRGNARVRETLFNNAQVSLTDNSTDDRLTVKSLAGTGTYTLDVDTATMTGDKIRVVGGDAKGSYKIYLNYLNEGAVPALGEQLTLIDADGSRGDKNTYNADVLNRPVNAEVVYDFAKNADNDFVMTSGANPAAGAIFGNVTLVQSLIGTIVNRPTSPFVTGLAYEDEEKPCGVGSWGRATGGSATATGSTSTRKYDVLSTVNASYYGMQVGTDLACFDNRYGGWNMAFGVLGGVNKGDTTQPLSVVGEDGSPTDAIASITDSDFTQGYAGVYMTATRGQFQADLQYRYEYTDFTMSNTAVVEGGLSLDETEFSSTAHTVSGSVSYAFPIAESGWTVLPTAGFAYSQTQTDSVAFSNGYQISPEDSKRKIGFVGSTIARSFVQESNNSAIYAFATGTYYKDFAGRSISIFTDERKPNVSERLASDNLDSFGEISIGANYVKVLGSGARARQFSTSARVDARFGDDVDSVGVTGQVRWQF